MVNSVVKAAWEPGHRERMIRNIVAVATQVSQGLVWPGGVA